MRILVTGAAGFIGSSVSEALLARGDEVSGVDDFNDFYSPKIKGENVREVLAAPGAERFTLVRADIVEDMERMGGVFEDDRTRPDAVLHLAAWAGVRPSIERPLVYQKNNVEGTLR